jgi:mannose-6-phosphate isomerase-like protein (cupin superfamily)
VTEPMGTLQWTRLGGDPDTVAPDGSDVRVLLGLEGGGMAHFTLGPGRTSRAVAHRTVEEIWYVVSGHGELWRSLDGQEEVLPVEPGVCATIPLGTHFQFRAREDAALMILGVTMPPWPAEDEAYPVPGPWPPTAPAA